MFAPILPLLRRHISLRTLAFLLVLGALLIQPAAAQLTMDQKLADFQHLAAIYAKNYKPHEWKLSTFGYNLLDLKPWIEKVRATKNDLEFYDICVRYVAALRDSHDEFWLPTDFVAEMPLYVDIYDNKVLIEYVDRSVLPFARFPIFFGDEVVSVDGKPVSDWIEELIPYSADGSGNDVTARRLAADKITYRPQTLYPFAALTPDKSTVVIRGYDGSLGTYEIPWTKTGTPLLTVGPVPSPSMNSVASARGRAATRPAARRAKGPVRVDLDEPTNPSGIYSGPEPEREVKYLPPYLQTLEDLSRGEGIGATLGTAAYGFRAPVFDFPSGFVLRLGGSSTDQIVSGTFPQNGYRVGFIRLWTMSPTNQTLALAQLQSELAYMAANTRGLVLDVMHNGGGSLCYVETINRLLQTKPFRGVTYEIRATEFWTQVFSANLTAAKAARAEQWVIDLYTAYLADVERARLEMRGSTGDLPICTVNYDGITPVSPYPHPILVLTNEFTLSAAEGFSAMLQDTGRATIFGTRTAGGGGNPASYNVGAYGMGMTRATRSLFTRAKWLTNPGFPAANHVENTGVYPDIWEDFQTEENLITGGYGFVTAFTSAIADLIRQNQ